MMLLVGMLAKGHAHTSLERLLAFAICMRVAHEKQKEVRRFMEILVFLNSCLLELGGVVGSHLCICGHLAQASKLDQVI